MNKKGIFCISLDFELMWGGIELWSSDGYGQTNIRQVPQVIERLLLLFEKYGVHATFGAVGFVMYKDVEDLKRSLPFHIPSYERKECSPYNDGYIEQIDKKNASLYFAHNLVHKIAQSEGMEIGSHTFSHFYCWEKGQNKLEFKTDIEKSVEIAQREGFQMDSIIFPRNQVQDEYLSICSENGYKAYRGCAKKYYKNKTGVGGLIQKVLRFIDNYLPISGSTSFRYSEIEYHHGMFNIPASRFLRPFSKRLSFLENCRVSRIKREIRLAALKGEIYHIWWHPHNMGCNIDENFHILEEILRFYKECHELHGMVSMNMGEIANYMQSQKNAL